MAYTSVATIITRGFREGNIIPIGTAPTANEQSEAVDLLNALMWSSLGFEMGEDLADWEVPTPQRTAPVAFNAPQLPYPQNTDPLFTGFPTIVTPDIDVWMGPPKNSRIVWGGVTATAYFPEQPDNGSRMALIAGSGAGDGAQNGQIITLDGNGRTINGANTYTATWPLAAEVMWVYHADTGNWVPFQSILYTDTMPFPPSSDDFWTLALAIRLAPRFGKQISPETSAAFKRAEQRFKAKFRQSGTTQYGASDFPRSLQSYIAGLLYF